MGIVDISLEGIGGLFKDIRTAITGEEIFDENKRAEIEAKLVAIENAMRTKQMEVNKEEAKHKSLFVAGWRPAIGWVGASALMFNYIVQPFLFMILSAFKVNVQVQQLEITALITIVTTMLGMGALRTYDKVKSRGSDY